MEDSAFPNGGGEETSQVASSNFTPQNIGSYKRRSRDDKWATTTRSLEDGYSWRKYGQKDILGQPYPRTYYRCAHKMDQGCQAVKQVERDVSEPTLFRVTYNGKHICTPRPPSSPAQSDSLNLSHGLGVGGSSAVIVLAPDHDLFSLQRVHNNSQIAINSEHLQEQYILSTITNSNNSNIYEPNLVPVEASSSSLHSCFTSDHQDVLFDEEYPQGGEWEDEEVDGDFGAVLYQQCRLPPEVYVDSPLLTSASLWYGTNVRDDLYGVRGITLEMIHCFSIFFLIPADYEFEEDTLIQLWMAQECVKDEYVGQEHFNFLLIGKYLLHSGTNFVTRKARYRINTSQIENILDLPRDMNGCFYLKWENESQRNVTNSAAIQHVSLLYNDIDAVFETLEQFPELKTLLFLHNYSQSVTQVPDHLFFSLQKLQALDLSCTQIKKLSNFVGNLIHLRFLDLSWTLIERLPDTICSLEQLQTFKLRGCSKLHGLPAQLKRLTKLRHLDVDVLRQLATIPAGIGALVDLRTLSAFMVGTDDGFKIQELKELNSLIGDFCIAMLENVCNADEAKEAALNNKQYLNKLELRWTASQLLRTNNNCYDVLKCLQPCSSLKELQIFCYEGSKFPNWVGDSNFNQLVSITFFKCENVSELPLVEQLPRLKHLELVKMNGVKKIERRGESEKAAFFSLEKLEVDEMQSLRCWNWVKENEDDFKNLIELSINDCPHLCYFHVLHCLSAIKHLEVKGCLKLESLSETRLPDSLEDLIVEDCPLIKRKCSEQGGEDWIKIQHVSNIRICEDDDDDDDDEC